MQALDGKIAHLEKREGNVPSIENLIFKDAQKIESWFKSQWEKIPAPINSSVDLRYSGYKLAPVDTNLFPAGFNNISTESSSLCKIVAQIVLDKLLLKEKRILILPENHTRNVFYFQSLKVLYDILANAGYEVRLGSLDPEQTHSKKVEISSQQYLTLEPVVREGKIIKVGEFIPDLVILNNDLSSGIPDILLNLNQEVVPAVKLGWSSRLKSNHFYFYQQIVNEFAEKLAIDPWLLNPYFTAVDEVDFMSQTGLDELINHTRVILEKTKEKYVQYAITDKPFVVIKADNGTYGMSVMTIHDESELKQLNRKQRTKMATIKGGQKVHRVMIQEGVYTAEYKSNASVAEPVIYMMGPYVIGGFYRSHQQKGMSDNLNTPGMYFEPMNFIKTDHLTDENLPQKLAHLNPIEGHRFYAYSVIARLAALAAGKENQAII